MPRPLKILKGIVLEDMAATREKVSKLLGDSVATTEEALAQLSDCLRLLLEIDRATKADRSIVDLGARFWNDIRASNTLLHEGLILPATMMLRDAVETRVLAEYFHLHPEQAEAWQKARNRQERGHFDFKQIKGDVEDGQKWYDFWNGLSSYIHPTAKATITYRNQRPLFGHNLYLGGFYRPFDTVLIFEMQQDICINFLDSLAHWYKDYVLLDKQLLARIELLEETHRSQKSKLFARAESEQKDLDGDIKATRLSGDAVIKLFKTLDTLT